MDGRFLVIGFVVAVLVAAGVICFWLVIYQKPGPVRPPERPGSGPIVDPADDPTDDLATIPYARWTRVAPADRHRRGVTRYVQGRAHDGLNLYASLNRKEVRLVDMDGELIHRWASEEVPDGRWQHVELLDDGGLLLVITERALVKLDAQSKILWQRPGAFHHDVAPTSSGDILALVNGFEDTTYEGIPFRIVTDVLLTLAPDGQVRHGFPLLPLYRTVVPDLVESKLAHRAAIALRFSPEKQQGKTWQEWLASGPPRLRQELALLSRLETESPETFARIRSQIEAGRPVESQDLGHTNTVEVVSRAVPGFAEAGDLLVCARAFDLIALIRPDAKDGPEIVWHWGPGELEWPHQPTLTPEGTLLIFDNGTRRGHSRVIELDPATRTIVWQYRASPPTDFFSRTRGGNQILPGGTVLITDSNSGRAFEVDRQGEIYWEFLDPVIREARSRGGAVEREAIYRLTRLPREHPGLPPLDR